MRSSRRPLAGTLLTLLTVLTLVILAIAVAGDPAPAATLDGVRARAGWAGRFRPGRPVPVVVTGLRAGDLVEARVPGGGTAAVTRTEATGARMVMPVATSWAATTARVAVTVRRGSDDRRLTATARRVSDGEVVGALGGLGRDARPEGSVALAGGGTATVVALSAADVAPGTMGPFGTIAATATALTRLEPARRTALAGWISAGGRLLIDGDETPGVLPGAWRASTEEPRRPAGLGEVRLTRGDLAAGRWDRQLEATPTVTPDDIELVNLPFAAAGPPAASLGLRAGTSLPAPLTMLLLALAWALIAGPALWWLLRHRRRPELAWVALPVLALVATAASWVGTSAGRETTSPAWSAWVLETSGVGLGGAVLATSDPQGDATVSLPNGWQAGPLAAERFATPGRPAILDATTGSRQVELPLVDGQLGTALLTGVAPPTARLVVTARVAGGIVAGTVANSGRRLLSETAVFVGPYAVRVGRLAAGASRPFRIDARQAPAGELAFIAPEARVWPTAVRVAEGRNRYGTVDGSAWATAVDALGPDLRTPASAVAVGWSVDLPGPTPDLARGDGTTAVIGRAPVVAASVSEGWAVRRDLLRGRDGDQGGPVVRFVVPSGAGETSVRVPPSVEGLDIWIDGRWMPIGLDESSPDPAARPRQVAVPAGAVQRQVVLVRVDLRPDALSAPLAELLLRGARP